MDNVLKILWLIIAILLLVILPVAGYFLINDRFFFNDRDAYVDEGPIVGTEQKEAVAKEKVIPRLVYDRIERIPGTNYYMLPLSGSQLRTPEGIKTPYEKFGGTRSKAGDLNMSSMDGNVNFIFLDIDYKVINVLLDQRAFIRDYHSPSINYDRQETTDPTVKNILFLIGFEDTNNDGLLNELDDQDLYISEVDGSNLRQVTRNVHILDVEFINHNTEVLIAYENRDSIANDHKLKRFGKYQIGKDSLLEFSDLHEKILELEKQLRVDTVQHTP